VGTAMKSFALALGFCAMVTCASAQYTLTEIPIVCDDFFSVAGSLTDQGAFTATCFRIVENPWHREYHPFLFDKHGFQDLGFFGFDYPVYASAINKRRQIVGTRESVNGPRAFLWSDGMVKDLGTLGGSMAVALGINDFGHVVGAATLPDGTSHAFLYRTGAMEDLGTFGGRDPLAWAINNKGQIVISRTFDTNYDATVLSAIYSNGTLQEIGSLGGRITYGYAINSLGHVVGTSMIDIWGTTHAFFYHEGQIEDISRSYDTSSNTSSINDRDEIVGSWRIEADADFIYGGFLYKDGMWTDISELFPPNSGWTIQYAAAINNAGQILGGGMHNGAPRLFLLTPVKGREK
jgi:probable HAF family extracellular repeat protein